MSDVPIAPGAILRGKYRLAASIGKGGMGEVFEAADLLTGAQVAIKVVSRHFVDSLLMARLHREAEAARRIQSEFVPYLYEVDYTDEGELFLAMERLFGETLAERMRRQRAPMTWQEVRRVGDDVLRGLIDAHAAGVIHRDLKPGNIFLEAGPNGEPCARARILDFGVCKLDTHDGDSLTSTGEAVGTIAYMAPEQIRGASKVDERADLYSFAMVVFEALSGRLAHDAQGQIALIASKLERPARNLREVARVPVPHGLDALLARCLSRKPTERPATAAELLRAWRALGHPTVVPNPTPIASFTPMSLATQTALTAAPETRIDRRGTRLGLVLAACGLVAASGVLVVALRMRANAAQAAPAPTATIQAAAQPADPIATATIAAAPPPTGTSDVEPDPEPIASALPDDAVVDAGAKPRATTTRSGGARAVGGTAPRRPPPTPPSTPQISVEPRY